jgi:hypothetical protein
MLEVGMKVTAVCMGREVGNYVVNKVTQHNIVTLKVENGQDDRTILADREVGENGLVTVKVGGVKIQATDYFVKPYDEE